jgi:hypothetical protein
VTDYELDESNKNKVEVIEEGLVNRIAFAERQQRFVAKLHREKSLLNSDLEWFVATAELEATENLAWKWYSQKLLQYTKAFVLEINHGIDNTDWNSGLSRILSQLLERNES